METNMKIPLVSIVEKLRFCEIVLDSYLDHLVIDTGQTQEIYGLGDADRLLSDHLSIKHLMTARIYPDRYGILISPVLLHIDLGFPKEVLEDGSLMLDQNNDLLYVGFKGQNRIIRVS